MSHLAKGVGVIRILFEDFPIPEGSDLPGPIGDGLIPKGLEALKSQVLQGEPSKSADYNETKQRDQGESDFSRECMHDETV